MPRKFLFPCLILWCIPTWAYAQDQRGEIVTTTPEYQGIRANAPIPPEMHIQNEGGSDGAGLCVDSSIISNGAYQGVADLWKLKDSALWKLAKSSPGGNYPEKLEQQLKSLYPDEKWISLEGDSVAPLEAYSKQGYPIAATMNTGALYHYQPIHHYVQPIHIDAQWACIVDNNDPGKYHWMPRSEYDRRFRDGPKGWWFVWLKKPRSVSWLYFVAASLVVASGLLLVSSPGGFSR